MVKKGFTVRSWKGSGVSLFCKNQEVVFYCKSACFFLFFLFYFLETKTSKFCFLTCFSLVEFLPEIPLESAKTRKNLISFRLFKFVSFRSETGKIQEKRETKKIHFFGSNFLKIRKELKMPSLRQIMQSLQ